VTALGFDMMLSGGVVDGSLRTTPGGEPLRRRSLGTTTSRFALHPAPRTTVRRRLKNMRVGFE
jgi:hypothetical protein